MVEFSYGRPSSDVIFFSRHGDVSIIPADEFQELDVSCDAKTAARWALPRSRLLSRVIFGAPRNGRKYLGNCGAFTLLIGAPCHSTYNDP